MKNSPAVTLLELLIAMVILVIILVGGGGIYLSGWRIFRDAQFRTQANRNALVAMSHMVKNIARSYTNCDVSGPNLSFFSYQNDLTTTFYNEYAFAAGTIEYTRGTNTSIIGRHITSCIYDPSHNNNIIEIQITATDNNGNNPYTLTSRAQTRYSACPSGEPI